MRRAVALVPLSALVLLAGCGGGDTEETASTGTSATSTAVPAAPTTTSADSADDADATDAPPFPADTALDTGEAVPGEGPTAVTGIRTGSQDGFTRVVFDISGTQVPGWYVTYVDAPYDDPKGDLIDMPGAAFLAVSLLGVTNPYEEVDVDEVPGGPIAADVGPVAGLYYDGVFEGQALTYVGTDAEQPFWVYSLTNPTRIVVDVQD